ncbi:class I SAM-dependent methyltransferase [Bacillus cytotoxicus]|uniref:class I SAM-dependent methyltransferase n=1 Tax=Bacillus cereus group TaxID=86661 RepID=UPI0006603982|nr:MULTISPECIES: class I SAM-dependent methyltransferase [Bacillus cereus group]AWC33134.1 class I SAM-dependent methyltransferase [Bacillus cytotoxicus]AWC37161.1 class I SAM-dependent methyltransferase [Bacillus cytotoxicus]AWC61425.1 class I SAM-dependent methyltransferase [Bacillus cytotoxicus]KMT49019.1 methyltransferase [Bacillus cytotoxicus]QTR78423.1 class I SAM-dependent methyltransferase [Bacillus cytotoxicus]
MKRNTYIDFLAYYGIGSAHPGGFTLTKQVLAQMPLGMHANVLEVGCGTGRTAAYMSQVYGYQVTAVENNEMMIQKARDRWLAQGLSIDLIQGKVEQLPCKDETFELVLGESILAFTNKEQSIPECYRVLQNNGKLVVIEMVLESPLDKEAETTILQLYGMEELLTETEWIHLFQKANFQRIIVGGGGTIAETVASQMEEPEWNVSQFIPKELYHTWVQHEQLLHKYQHMLGHRVFICEK